MTRFAVGVAGGIALLVGLRGARGADEDATAALDLLELAEDAPGARLPTSPRSMPATDRPEELPTLAAVRRHLQEGDPGRALRAAEAASKRADLDASEKTGSWVAVGALHREAGRPGLAAEAFRQAAAGEGPLVSWATYFHAEQSLRSGRPLTAVEQCRAYRERWPEGAHAAACLRVLGKALARLGDAQEARRVAEAYDKAHRQATIGEQVELEIARHLATDEPQAAATLLRALVVRHDAPLTGRVAEELLGALHERGVESTTIPDDPASLAARAASLRAAGRLKDAWAVYLAYAERTGTDPVTFAWATRQWDWLVERYESRVTEPVSADDAWRLARAYERAGRWQEAARWAAYGLDNHGRSRAWRTLTDKLGLTFLLAGDFAHARTVFMARAKRRGWTGRRARFLAGFTAYRAGDHDRAIADFDAVLDATGGADAASRYWRSRALDALGRDGHARVDRERLRGASPDGWYAMLAAQRDDGVPAGRLARDGTWPGAPSVAPRTPSPWEVAPAPPARPAPMSRTSSRAVHALGWPLRAPQPPTMVDRAVLALLDLSAPPRSYADAPGWSEADARQLLADSVIPRLARWPEFIEAIALADCGLYDLSGPRMAEAFVAWTRARSRRSDSRHRAARDLDLGSVEWRLLFTYTRDHYDAARRWNGWDRYQPTDEGAAAVRRLAWPLAHDRVVWKHAREHDVDPYLVFGLMRVESNYNPNAVSRVGARGAMQIMPRTGNLLADLVHDEEFTTGDVEDPVVAAELGITYIGLLMERFGGAWPLAVASYNGGPHNMSAWLRGTGLDMPLDEVVEHIPFPETRRYVEKVSGAYAGYLGLYAPTGSRPVVPPTTPRDAPEIVDF